MNDKKYRVMIKDFNGKWIFATLKYSDMQSANSVKCEIKARHRLKNDEIKIVEVDSEN
jgi:hypothetical protein